MDKTRQDLRHAFRTLSSHPGFAAVAVVTLAVGLGLNTAIFSVVNTVLLRPLPVSEPEELLAVYTAERDETPDPYGTSSYPDYLDLRRDNDVFTELAGHAQFLGTLSREGSSEMLIGEVVTGNFFRTLGVKAWIGRGILPEDDVRGAPPVAVVGHSFWRHRLGADPEALGSTLKINGVDYRIVGVTPANFPGSVPGIATVVWIPTAQIDAVEPAGRIDVQGSSPGDSILDHRGYRWLWMTGRLKEGITVAQAESQLETIMGRLAADHVETNEDRGIEVLRRENVGIHPDLDAYIAPAFALVFGVVGLVLIVACANVANMLLARGAARHKELAIRQAIGAGRGRLVRQLLTESLVIAVLAGGLGLLLAIGGVRFLSGVQPPFAITIPVEFAVDVRVFAFAFLAALATGVVFGLVPALQASRPDLVPALKDEGPGRRRSRRGLRLQDGLVIAQVGVSVVLLVGGVLLARSLSSAERVDLGFEPRRIVNMWMALEFHGYDTEESMAFFGRARERLGALPGVEAVGWTTRTPLSINQHSTSFTLPDAGGSATDRERVSSNTSVGPGYFEVLDLRFVRGRSFDERDRGEGVRTVVVNEAFAARYWPDADPIGRRIRSPGTDGVDYTVIGVVGDYNVNTVGEDPTPLIHFSHLQRPSSYAGILVRTRGDAASMVETVRRELLEMEPDLAFLEAGTLWDNVAVTLWPLRMAARILGGMGMIALLLAAVGLYGVVAYAVSRRTREIGIRMALGARARDVIALVMRQGMVLVGIGAAVGVLLAALGTRLLSSVLYGVGAVDPLSFGGAVAIVLSIALAAHWVPARRATRVDPIEAVKTE